MLLKLFKDDKALNNFFLIYKIDWIENVHRLLKVKKGIHNKGILLLHNNVNYIINSHK